MDRSFIAAKLFWGGRGGRPSLEIDPVRPQP